MRCSTATCCLSLDGAPTIELLDDWLGRRARTHAERPALIDGRRDASTTPSSTRARRARARRLAALGVGEGERVATTLPPGPTSRSCSTRCRGWALAGPAEHAADRRRAALAGGGLRRAARGGGAARRGRGRRRAAQRRSTRQRVCGDLHLGHDAAAYAPVALTHAQPQASALASAWNLGVDAGDRWLCVLPLFHVGGLAILTALGHLRHRGGRRTSASTPSGWRGARGRRGHAGLAGADDAARLVDAGLEEAPALRAALLGGGPVPRDLLEWAAEHGLPVLQTYGMTETCSQIATLTAAEAVARPARRAARCREWSCRSPARARSWCAGRWCRPARCAEDGWLHTGDRGRARRRRLPVGGGPPEGRDRHRRRERAPAPRWSACSRSTRPWWRRGVGVPDPEWGELVTAYVVLSNGVARQPS